MIRCTVCLCAAILFSVAARAADPSPELLDLAKQLKARDAKTRLKAAESLREKGKDAAPVAKELCDAIAADADKMVVGACLGALEQARPDLYAPVNAIRLSVSSKSLGAGHDDAAKLSKLGAKAKPATGVLLSACKNSQSNDDLLAYLKALAAVEADDPAAVVYCKTLLTTGKGFDPALDIYGKWAIQDEKRDRDFLPILKARLGTPAGLRWASEMGPRAKPLLPDLKKLANSTDEKVRTPALAAIEKIGGEK